MSIAYLHLVLNLQPDGGFTGLGTSPLSTILLEDFAISGSGMGIDDSNASV